MTFNKPGRSLLFMLLFIVCAVVYGNTFFNSWTYDDMPVVVQNPDAHSLAGFIENHRPGRPMRELTYIPEYHFFGTNPAGYHIQQLFWHASNACLLLVLIIMLGIDPLYALCGAVYFLVHPLQSESVANISHRKELLALFFSLTSLIFYIKAVASQKMRLVVFLLLAGSAYLCALLSNQTSMTLPLLFVIYEYVFLDADERLILKYPKCLAILLTVASVALVYRFRGFLSYDQLLSTYSKYSFVATESFFPLWMADLKAIGFYLCKIVMPVNLAPEYHVSFSENLFQPLALISAVLLVGIVSLFFLLRLRIPAISFGIGWFMALYLPVSNILPVSYLLADRYMYLCLPGVAVLIACTLNKLKNKKLNLVCVVLLAALGVITIIQNSYWKDEHTLWRHAVTVNPDSTWVQETVALSYLLSNQFDLARHHAKIAIKLNRYNTRAYLTLAKSEDRLGNLNEAIKHYESFGSFGVQEFPAEVADVKKYLPFLRNRAQLLYYPER